MSISIPTNSETKIKVRSFVTILLIISTILLFTAIIRGFSYGYYIFLRWIVLVSALSVILKSHDLKKRNWIWIMGIIAILFNPIIPIHFSKITWRLIDLITAIIFITTIFRVTEHSGNYLVYGERGLDCLEMALHPYQIHWERSKQKIQKEYLNLIESGEIIAPSYSYCLTQAIHNFTKAIKLNSKCATSYFNRAYSYLIGREFQKAVDDYTKMIELNPQDVDIVVAYFYRGCAYRELGEVKKALSDYNKAMQLDPEDSAFYKKCIENLEKEEKK